MPVQGAQKCRKLLLCSGEEFRVVVGDAQCKHLGLDGAAGECGATDLGQ